MKDCLTTDRPSNQPNNRWTNHTQPTKLHFQKKNSIKENFSFLVENFLLHENRPNWHWLSRGKPWFFFIMIKACRNILDFTTKWNKRCLCFSTAQLFPHHRKNKMRNEYLYSLGPNQAIKRWKMFFLSHLDYLDKCLYKQMLMIKRKSLSLLNIQSS